MNFKKLAFWTTLFTTAAVPLATAQNPVILQGNYISNVFGQSNFVKNPNAQTNVANVTVSSATVTRSATTPLVATSEFNITTSTATGYADWATRTFDAGMKNQNCEARFSYRGFSVGSTKAQLIQNSLVVAELTLTSSTDPRIASINFPCGDLTYATTFRLQQATASLTGTNEIGGIYVGLATNQANVAQAEAMINVYRQVAQSVPAATDTTVLWDNEGLDQLDEYTPATGIYKAKRAGQYLISAQVLYDITAWPAATNNDIYIYKNNAQTFSNVNYTQAAVTTYVGTQVTATVQLSAGDEIKIIVRQGGGGGSTKSLLANGQYNHFKVYRFPSSSELVVTPERQNVWGSKKFSSSGVGISLHAGATSPTATTTFNSASITQTNLGKCGNTTTANDIGCKISNMPVGSYQVTYSGFLRTYTAGGSASTNCLFELYETTTSTSVVGHSAVAAGQVSEMFADGKNITGVFVNTSVTDRNFVLRAKKQGGATTGYCQIYTDTNDIPQIIITPLDQPSNSALYVQGPVKSAGTGDAIAAGYVGEVKQGRLTAGCVGAGVYRDGAAVTLTPGVWRVTASVNFEGNTFNDILTFISPQSGNVLTWRQSYYNDAWQSLPNSTAGSKVWTLTPPILVRYDGTNFYRFEDNTWKDAFASASGILYAKYYYAMNCVGVYSGIVAERVN